MHKKKQVPIRHLCVVVSKHFLHYVHCTSASSLVTKTPSAEVRVVHGVGVPDTAGREEAAPGCDVATVGRTRPIEPVVSGPIEFSRSF